MQKCACTCELGKFDPLQARQTFLVHKKAERVNILQAHSSCSTAVAYIKGGPLAPAIQGNVVFQEVQGGTMIYTYVTGLPPFQPAEQGKDPIGPHGFHIHEIGDCTVGDPEDPFKAAGEHWNPTNQPHGNHAGDFPVLFSNNGISYMVFFTNKFRPAQAIGKSIMIHQNPDDYRSQPAGDAGKRLACGIIQCYQQPQVQANGRYYRY